MHPEKIYIKIFTVNDTQQEIESTFWYRSKSEKGKDTIMLDETDGIMETVEYLRADTVIDPDKVKQLVEAIEQAIKDANDNWDWDGAVETIEKIIAQYHKE